MTTRPREVLGLDGHIATVGPDDVLIVRIAQRLTAEDGARVADQLKRVLGADRFLLFDEAAEITVARATPTPDPQEAP